MCPLASHSCCLANGYAAKGQGCTKKLCSMKHRFSHKCASQIFKKHLVWNLSIDLSFLFPIFASFFLSSFLTLSSLFNTFFPALSLHFPHLRSSSSTQPLFSTLFNFFPLSTNLSLLNSCLQVIQWAFLFPDNIVGFLVFFGWSLNLVCEACL